MRALVRPPQIWAQSCVFSTAKHGRCVTPSKPLLLQTPGSSSLKQGQGDELLRGNVHGLRPQTVRSDRGSRIGRGREMGTVAQQTETRGSSLGVTTSAISIAAPSSWPSRVAGAGCTRSGAEPAPSCWTAAPLGHRGSPRPITAMEGKTAGHTLHRDRHRAGPSGGSAPGNVTCTDNWFPALTVRQPRRPGHVGGSRHPHPDRYQAGTGEGQHGTPRPSLAGMGTFYIGAGGWGVGLHLHPPEPLKFSISFHGEYNR